MQEIARHIITSGCYQLALHFWMHVFVNTCCTNCLLSRVNMIEKALFQIRILLWLKRSKVKHC
jgi:hypothetical protein